MNNPSSTERFLQGAGLLAWLLTAWMAWRLFPQLDGAVGALGVVGLFAVFLAGFLYATRPGHRAASQRGRQFLALGLQAASALGLLLLFRDGVFAILLIVLFSQLPAYLGLRTCLAATGGFLLAFGFLLDGVWHTPAAWFQALLYTSFLLFAVFSSYQSVEAQRGREDLARLNNELTATQHLLAETAREAERSAIARDLHDTLGHHLTALSIQLEIASHLSEGAALAQVEKAQQVARLLLADVRAAVSDMRERGAIDLRAALRALVTEVPGLAVELELPEPFAIADPARAEALLRATQEIVTNTLRHAEARRLHLSFAHAAGRVSLHARDDGRGAPDWRAGNGLRGLNERIQALGGELVIASAPGTGFALDISLPEAQP